MTILREKTSLWRSSCFVGTVVRVKVLKRPNVATESEILDGFCVGDVYNLSAKAAILMTAAGWVRMLFARGAGRRSSFNADLHSSDRRLLPDRRTRVIV